MTPVSNSKTQVPGNGRRTNDVPIRSHQGFLEGSFYLGWKQKSEIRSMGDNNKLCKVKTEFECQKRFKRRLDGLFFLCLCYQNSSEPMLTVVSLLRFFLPRFSLPSLGSLLVILQPALGRAAEGAGGRCWHVCNPHLWGFPSRTPLSAPRMCPLVGRLQKSRPSFCGHINNLEHDTNLVILSMISTTALPPLALLPQSVSFRENDPDLCSLTG